MLLRCGYVWELAAASYPHIHGGGGDFPCIAGGGRGCWRVVAGKAPGLPTVTWEARKDYLTNMMRDSIENLMKQLQFFTEGGQSESACRYVMDGCMVGLHVKIGQLLNAWGATEPADKHAAALFVLSASPEHRHALAKWMPGGFTSPPLETELFEPGQPLMVFKNMSLTLRPGLSECWRGETGEAAS